VIKPTSISEDSHEEEQKKAHEKESRERVKEFHPPDHLMYFHFFRKNYAPSDPTLWNYAWTKALRKKSLTEQMMHRVLRHNLLSLVHEQHTLLSWFTGFITFISNHLNPNLESHEQFIDDNDQTKNDDNNTSNLDTSQNSQNIPESDAQSDTLGETMLPTIVICQPHFFYKSKTEAREALRDDYGRIIKQFQYYAKTIYPKMLIIIFLTYKGKNRPWEHRLPVDTWELLYKGEFQVLAQTGKDHHKVPVYMHIFAATSQEHMEDKGNFY
jgi:hypothetical protein